MSKNVASQLKGQAALEIFPFGSFSTANGTVPRSGSVWGRAFDPMAHAAKIARQTLRPARKGKGTLRSSSQSKKTEETFRRIPGKDGHCDLRLDGCRRMLVFDDDDLAVLLVVCHQVLVKALLKIGAS